MKRSEYEEYVDGRCKDYVTESYCVIALNEEAGEVAGWYKKYVLRGNPTGKLSKADLKGELGDTLFYLTRLARLNGWTLNDLMEANVAKLDDRVASGAKSIA
jgi:NTP pyrophosphatase (non-canonical NTP hydrolase)